MSVLSDASANKANAEKASMWDNIVAKRNQMDLANSAKNEGFTAGIEHGAKSILANLGLVHPNYTSEIGGLAHSNLGSDYGNVINGVDMAGATDAQRYNQMNNPQPLNNKGY